MTKGSWIHEALSRHFKNCAQCDSVRPEDTRIRQVPALRRTVPAAVLGALCPDGRQIYQQYLRWLAEPDE